jgi:hypothetical protein
MTKAILALSFLALGACATVHRGNMAEQTSGDKVSELAISALELSDPAKEGFSMVAFNFENKSDQWMRVEYAEVLIDEDAAKLISVVRGKDLVDWHSAMRSRAEMEQQNREMTQFGLALLGAGLAVGGAASGNRNTAVAGAAIYSASVSWAAADMINSQFMLAQNPKAVPSEYIYTSFSIPPGMFLRKWVLLNKPVGQRVTELPIAVQFVDGRRMVMNTKLNYSDDL